MAFIPYARQCVDKDDIQAVVDVLQSDWLTQGPAVERFEQAVAEYCGAKYAVAVNSATAALHIACLAAGLGDGDRLWTSPNTFVASANCGLYCGAKVDFVDIDPLTYNLSPKELEQKLSNGQAARDLPKVVIPVHFAGGSCDMEAIHSLARQYHFTVIEDASHAIGGRYKDKAIGCCAYSDMTVFSFHPVKIVTTGEGGMVVTNRRDLYEKLLLLRSHGVTRDESQMTMSSQGPWYYEQINLGFNYRITDIQAALGWSQLKKIDEFVARRQTIAERYDEGLAGMPLITQQRRSDIYSAFHLYVIRLKSGEIKKSHRQVFEELRQACIGVNLHYIPVHLQPYYQQRGFCAGDFPQAEQYYREAISLPMYYLLSEEDQKYVINTIRQVLA